MKKILILLMLPTIAGAQTEIRISAGAAKNTRVNTASLFDHEGMWSPAVSLSLFKRVTPVLQVGATVGYTRLRVTNEEIYTHNGSNPRAVTRIHNIARTAVPVIAEVNLLLGGLYAGANGGVLIATGFRYPIGSLVPPYSAQYETFGTNQVGLTGGLQLGFSQQVGSFSLGALVRANIFSGQEILFYFPALLTMGVRM